MISFIYFLIEITFWCGAHAAEETHLDRKCNPLIGIHNNSKKDFIHYLEEREEA